MADSKTARPITLQLLTPTRKILETTVSEVSIPGYHGEVGVLPSHAAFVCQLGFGVLSFLSAGTTQLYAVEGGVAEIRDDVVTVLADGAEEAAQIDAERARKALGRAQERLKGTAGRESVDIDRASRAEARALARLEARARLELLQK
jgi:F-type H+-transporting ATPase subunit epsilon